MYNTSKKKLIVAPYDENKDNYVKQCMEDIDTLFTDYLNYIYGDIVEAERPQYIADHYILQSEDYEIIVSKTLENWYSARKKDNEN